MKNEKEQEKGMKKEKRRGTKSYFSFIRSFNQSSKLMLEERRGKK